MFKSVKAIDRVGESLMITTMFVVNTIDNVINEWVIDKVGYKNYRQSWTLYELTNFTKTMDNVEIDSVGINGNRQCST